MCYLICLNYVCNSKVILIVFVCWIIGGIVAISLALLSPEFYRSAFPYTPAEKTAMLKFAWVGGSIWGGILGGVLSSVLSIVFMKNSWAKEFAKNMN